MGEELSRTADLDVFSTKLKKRIEMNF